MDFQSERLRDLPDSKAYGQWEAIMNNSGWFDNKLQNEGFKTDNESDVDEASTKEKIENSDKLKATETSLNALDYQQNILSKNGKDKPTMMMKS